MNKKISTLMVIFGIVAGTQFIQPTQSSAQVAGVVTDPGNTTVNIGQRVWDFTRDDVLIPTVKSVASRVLNKMTTDTINWANGGFDGDPGFINNWDEFLKGTEHEVISGAFTSATNAANTVGFNNQIQNNPQLQAEYNACLLPVTNNAISAEIDSYTTCMGGIDPDTSPDLDNECTQESNQVYESIINAGEQVCQNSVFTSDVATIAQQNFNDFQSGELNTRRAIANIIATDGSNKLNNNTLNSLIAGQGETLTTLLGSQSAKDAFKTDITVGGWEGYLALADPHNYDAGLQSLVTGALGQATTSRVSSVIQDVQTPQKFLDKRECAETDNATGECVRFITTTPGDVVAQRIGGSLDIENQQALSFSDALVQPLISSIGDLSDGLIGAGFSQLSSLANNAFFSVDETSELAAAAGTGYQSQYDVLGIQNDVTSTTAGSTVINQNGGNIFNPNGSTGFIGGPEDQDGTWNGGTQIVINFQEELERNINLAAEEKSYYDQTRNVLINATEIMHEFDKCTPGPDYNWEQRWNDVMGFESGEIGQLNQLGLNETRIMSNDPRVNIPSAIEMKNQLQLILDISVNNSAENKFRLDNITNALLSMNLIKSSILEAFNNQKQLISTDLVLFEEDWDILSQVQKQNLLNIAFDNGEYLGANFTENGTLNTAAALLNDPVGTQNAVLSMAWNLWRTETDPEEKLQLRSVFYSLQNSLSSDQLVTVAEARLNQTKQGIEQSFGAALDCMIFKSYAIGGTRTNIQNILALDEDVSDKIMGLKTAIDALDPFYTVTNTGIAPILGFYNVSSVRSDEDLRQFLENEYLLQIDGLQSTTSLFESTLITSPSSIDQSILGFNSEQEKLDYFDLYYPEEDFRWDENKNKTTVAEMYRVDRSYASTNRLNPRGSRGHLFCRNQNTFEIINSSGDGDQDGTYCWKDWYSGSILDFQVLVSGIN